MPTVVRHLGLSIVLLAALSRPAEAHFLFIRITPPAEGGRAAEVFFSERATAGDPRFIGKVAHTVLWRQTTPGRFEGLEVRQAADRLRAHLPASGSLGVVGFCEYGVLARPGESPFLLRYYPKALAGQPDELNRLERRKDGPLEIMATFDGESIELAALADGRPLSGAMLHIIDSELSEEEVTADADGRARWRPGHSGTWSIYVKRVLPSAGEQRGQRYDEIREFATLSFAWPLVRTQPDQEAVDLFEGAVAARAQWRDFPGFRARIAGSVDGRSFSGDVTVAANGDVKLVTDDEATREWVVGQLESIAMHRAASRRAAGEHPRLWYGDDGSESHPLGRLLIFDGGGFASSYRVKDRQITVVNRAMGAQNMTITVLDNQRTDDDHFLPRSYTVHYWDDASGRLQRSEAIDDRWTAADKFDLPLSHTVTASSDSGQSVRSFVLSQHELLEAGK
ncbi:MAG TPA: DUF3386 family protein [Pirellulales bacterium]|nr:DUF3386 family protein [Pirellulales bacterium]